MKERAPEGEEFERSMARKPITPSEMAEFAGVNPQSITHWKNRGVAAKYAHKVAAHLGVPAESISKVKDAQMSAEQIAYVDSVVESGDIAILLAGLPTDDQLAVASVMAKSLSKKGRTQLLRELLQAEIDDLE